MARTRARSVKSGESVDFSPLASPRSTWAVSVPGGDTGGGAATATSASNITKPAQNHRIGIIKTPGGADCTAGPLDGHITGIPYLLMYDYKPVRMVQLY